jgi:2-oxoglutarate dehydrogenase complex dehydrogenase (E1) component-like enzyme
MYELIESHTPVRQSYTHQLVQRGDISPEDEQAVEFDFKARLERAFEETQVARGGADPDIEIENAADLEDPDPGRSDADASPVVVTKVTEETIARVVDGLTRWPEGFVVHPKLERQLLARRGMVERDEIDWALGEALAFGSLVLEGTAVRLAGQDTRRGTFSQRHGVLVDQETEAEYVQLAHLADDQAPFMLYDTVLSEYAALGFEYGYSTASDALVCWEAQFGDFANAAQVVIDQFVVAANDKWGQRSGIALLLPHGLEGQGPEHSSARIERYLTLSAEANLRVVYPTTAAQYFHLLRRQARARQVPLVCFTPKRYLRMPQTRSPLHDFTDGRFETVLDDRAAPDEVRRVLLCTGKIAHELMAERDTRGAPAAVVRVEQLFPWPEPELLGLLDRYPNARQVWWVQEEPANMGAWFYAHDRLHRVLRDRNAKLRHIARAPSASPASGSSKVHDREQKDLLAAAFAKLD